MFRIVAQSELLSLSELKFRQYAVVVSADIAKMYRQNLDYPSQKDWQQNLCLLGFSELIEMYSLNKTYGIFKLAFWQGAFFNCRWMVLKVAQMILE